jgi:arginase
MDDTGLELADGIEARQVIPAQAFEVIRHHDPARIVTLGGECAVSVAPFSALARRYGDDLAIIWIDSHPDIGTPASQYPGFHAMAVAALTGHGDPKSKSCCRPSSLPTAWRWSGCTPVPPTTSPTSTTGGSVPSAPTTCARRPSPWETGWPGLAARGSHPFDVDTIDSNELVLGLGAEPGGLTTAQVRRIVDDLDAVTDVVGITVAEIIPRQVMHLQQLLAGFPLLRASTDHEHEIHRR